jgi:O-antigen/teichoic acid export membrane protein
LLANNLQISMISQPHNVIGATLDGYSYRNFTTSLLLSQALYVTIITTLVFTCVLIMAALGMMPYITLALIFVFCLISWQIQEFCRRVLYTEGRLVNVLMNDTVSYGGLIVSILGLWLLGLLNMPIASLALAVTFTFGAAIGLWQIRTSLCTGFSIEPIRKSWDLGKWLAAAMLSFWIAIPIYQYVLAFAANVSAVAVLRAALVLVGPLNIPLTFLDSVLPSRLSRRLSSSGEDAMQDLVRRSFIVITPMFLIYCMALSAFSRDILRTIYGGWYAEYSMIVVYVAFYYLLMYPIRILSPALSARHVTRSILISHILGAIVTVTIGIPLTYLAGVTGASVGMILSTIVTLSAIIWFYFSTDTRLTSSHPLKR